MTRFFVFTFEITLRKTKEKKKQHEKNVITVIIKNKITKSEIMTNQFF